MTQEKKVPEIRFKGFSGEWFERELGEITSKIGSGKTPKGGDSTYVLAGIPLIRSQNIYNNLVNLDNVAYILPQIHEDMKNSNVFKNDVLLNITGASIGRSAVYTSSTEANVNQHVCIIRLYEGYDSAFTQLHLTSSKGQQLIDNNQAGGAREGLNFQQIARMKFNFTQATEQTQIGSYFKKLDNLINQHQQKHGKLNSIKKAMLEKMFPKQGETIPKIRFKEFSGEWEEKRLGDIGDTFTGLAGKSKHDFGHGQARFVTYMNVFSNAISDENLVEPIEIDEGQNEVKKGDVFFTTSSETPEEVGMSSIWMGEARNVYLNSFCFGYRPKQKIDSLYLAYMLRASSFRKQVIFLAQGVSRYNISKTKVMDIKIYIPSFLEQEKIGNYFQKLDALINQHQQQIIKLNNIKQACLSKMFV